ncbi:hypothetical protein C2S52_006645 [Perilla frutescens var. hirtella]|nr:hypothetical protein C2S52_006645 [Perilla frutescens var. hirtella]
MLKKNLLEMPAADNEQLVEAASVDIEKREEAGGQDTLLDSAFIHISIIDTWALLLDQFEKHNTRVEERGQPKIFFTAQYYLYVGDVLKLKNALESMKESEIDEDRLDAIKSRRKMLKGYWNYSLEWMGSMNGMITADLLFLSVHSGAHFFLTMIDFREGVNPPLRQHEAFKCGRLYLLAAVMLVGKCLSMS